MWTSTIRGYENVRWVRWSVKASGLSKGIVWRAPQNPASWPLGPTYLTRLGGGIS